ncbi:MAG TPA: VOC family protein [Gemmatimonadales bacterium]|nr:VOC family protein [Gemmatimonadales bacterium]
MDDRVIGIGGIFFKARNKDRLLAWYREHLGVDVQDWGGAMFAGDGQTVWTVFKHDSDYFGPGEQRYMINYRVSDLGRILARLRAEGVTVDARTEESEFGKFGWIVDPEGNRVELWETTGG